MALTEKLKSIADAIRSKTGKTDALTLVQMVVEIAGIQTGGVPVPGVIFIDCITMLQNSEYGYGNGLVVPFTFSDVGMIDVRAKFPTTGNWIWLCGYLNDKTVGNYINKIPANVITNESDENGVTHLKFNLNLTTLDGSDPNLKIGSWSDGAYSQSIVFYEINIYNTFEEPLVCLRPAVNEYGKGIFVDTMTGTIYRNVTGNNAFAPGEVV